MVVVVVVIVVVVVVDVVEVVEVVVEVLVVSEIELFSVFTLGNIIIIIGLGKGRKEWLKWRWYKVGGLKVFTRS